jgi:hypothetical protein
MIAITIKCTAMRKIKLMSALLVTTCIILSACYKNRTVLIEPEVTRTVTFSKDIIPIFNTSCNMSGCHNAGGIVPDLSQQNAYNALINGNFIDKTTAEKSVLYLKMSGNKGTPMPVSGVNYDYAAMILAWIKQGAENN